MSVRRWSPRLSTYRQTEESTMAYHLEGRLLEVCTCKAFCPCWVGEDPDNGTCDGLLAWHIEKGTTDGVDVGGLTIGGIAHIPGNVLEGNWRMVVLLDERATKEQEQALLAVWTGSSPRRWGSGSTPGAR
jgi:hypothetical protein